MVTLGGSAAAEPTEKGTEDSTEPSASTSSTSRGFRVLQVVSGSLFAVSYLPGVVVAAVYRGESDDQRSPLGVLAYPVAGPFLTMATLESGAPLFIPLGVFQGLSAVGFIVGAAGAAAESDAEAGAKPSSTLQVTPLASQHGGGLQIRGQF
jgi:hypothetical protein